MFQWPEPAPGRCQEMMPPSPGAGGSSQWGHISQWLEQLGGASAVLGRAPLTQGPLQGQIQMVLLQQEGAPRSTECAIGKEQKGIPALTATSD